MNYDNNPPDYSAEEKSKSQVKREMTALQKLGERLTQLNQEQLSKVPLEENLAAAIKEYQRLKKNEAKRRQLQYIGRLMRDADADAIQHAINRFDASQAEHTQLFHLIENWRERLLNDGDAITEFISSYPGADIQALRQLIRTTQKERRQNKDLGSYRKLFRQLREIIEPEVIDN